MAQRKKRNEIEPKIEEEDIPVAPSEMTTEEIEEEIGILDTAIDILNPSEHSRLKELTEEMISRNEEDTEYEDPSLEVKEEPSLHPSTMTILELKQEVNIWQSKLELGTITGRQSERLDEIEEELERRQPKHFKVSAQGKTTEWKGPKNMAMFDPSNTGLGNAIEPKAVDEGEYKLSIVNVRVGVTKTGKDYWQPTLEIVGVPTSKDFTHYLGVPDREKMPSEKEYINSVFELQNFMDCFQLPYDRPFNPAEEWPGSEGWWIVGKKKDDQYGEQNFLTRGGAIPPK